jgi:hypothetical protein
LIQGSHFSRVIENLKLVLSEVEVSKIHPEVLMSYPDAEYISQSYASNHWLIRKLTEGLTHADSLAQAPFKANCLNWVVGHILSGRVEALNFMGVPSFWSEEERAHYVTGSDPITSDAQALPFGKLLSDLDLSQEQIEDTLSEISDEALAEVVETRFGPRPVGEHVASLHWHETYHLGQLELLRELAGPSE